MRGFAAGRGFLEGFGAIARGVFSSSLSHRIEFNHGVPCLAIPANCVSSFPNNFFRALLGNPKRARSVPHAGRTAVIDSDRALHVFSINPRSKPAPRGAIRETGEGRASLRFNKSQHHFSAHPRIHRGRFTAHWRRQIAAISRKVTHTTLLKL